MVYPLPDIDVSAGRTNFQIQREMAVPKNVKIMMCLLLLLATPDKKILLFFPTELFFHFHIVDATLSTPVLCNAHAKIRMEPCEKPLTSLTIKKPFKNL